jgi:DNA mismatch repair protein MSH3
MNVVILIYYSSQSTSLTCLNEFGQCSGPQKRSKKSKENSNSSALSKLKSSSNNTSSTAQKGKKEKIKYTPLELQYLEMKKKCPDAILFVEAGYRYRFFGEDAEVCVEQKLTTTYHTHSLFPICLVCV